MVINLILMVIIEVVWCVLIISQQDHHGILTIGLDIIVWLMMMLTLLCLHLQFSWITIKVSIYIYIYIKIGLKKY
jgi:hypothetical protein